MALLVRLQSHILFAHLFQARFDALPRRADARDALGFAQKLDRLAELVSEIRQPAVVQRAELQNVATARTERLPQIVVVDGASAPVARTVAPGLNDEHRRGFAAQLAHILDPIAQGIVAEG